MIKLSKIEHKRFGKKGFMLPGRRFTLSTVDAIETLNRMDAITSQIEEARKHRVVSSKTVTEIGAEIVRRESHNKRLFLGV